MYPTNDLERVWWNALSLLHTIKVGDKTTAKWFREALIEFMDIVNGRQK